MNTECTKYHSSKQEKRVSKTVKGKLVIGSGATPFMKGDVTSEDILYECKTNIKGQATMSVRKEWFDKAKLQAYEMGKSISVVVIGFDGRTEYYCIEDMNYRAMLEGYSKLNEIIAVMDSNCDKELDKIKEIIRGKF